MASEITRLLSADLHWNREASLAWAAGLLEGDGCILNHRRHSRVTVAMTDEDTVERFAEIVGGTFTGPYLDGTPRKPRWRSSLMGIDRLMDFYEEVEPYLGVRRRARFQEALVGVDTEGRISRWNPAERLWLPWAAGLFEAEGCVSFGQSPIMALVSTDRDVVDRFASIVGGPVYGPYSQPPTELGTPRKDQFCWRLTGRRSEGVAVALRPWLGRRRRSRIDEIFVGRKYYKRPGQRGFLQEHYWF